MTYLSDKRQSKFKYRKYIFFVLILGVLLYAWPTIRVKVYPYLDSILFGYGTTKHSFAIIPESVRVYFSSRNELLAKDQALLLTIERLENEVQEKNALLQEQGLLGLSGTTSPSSTLVLYPVFRDVTTLYKSIVLSKGFKSGVEIGSLVYVRGRQPVCTVSEVYDKTSLCTLLSANDQMTEGVIASNASSSLALTLRGSGGGSFVADVPRDTVVTVGDIVALRSDPSMILGTVVEVARNNQATSWHVYVRGMYNPVTSSVFYITK